MTNVLPMLVFESLVSGKRFIDDNLAFRMEDLKITPASFGGYWSLSFPVSGRQSDIEEWVEDGLGRHVELYSPELAVVFEGFVSQVSANIGGLSINVGPLIDTVANRIRCAYAEEDTGTGVIGTTEYTAWANDTTSQARYGIIERVFTLSTAPTGMPEQIRDTAILELAAPALDEKDNLGSSSAPSATVTVLGYIHWLKAYTYTDTTTGTSNADVKLQAVLGADPNGIFSTDYSHITANASTTATQDTNQRTAFNVVKGITALGDAAFNRWTFGLYQGRKAWYNALPDTIKYSRRLSSPRQSLELYSGGARVNPWNVSPAEWVFYTDLLVGSLPAATRRLDARHLMIEQSTYQVPWALTMSGAKVSRLDQMFDRLGLGGAVA